MQANGAVANLPGFVTKVPEALAKFPVQATVLHVFIEAINRNQVFGPGGAVHAVPAGGSGRDGIQECLLQGRAGQFPELVVLRLALADQPLGVKDDTVADIVVGNRFRNWHGEFDVSARQEHARLGQSLMGGDEVGFRDAVAVREDQVVAVGFPDGLVEDLALAKAMVLVPDMVDPQDAAFAELVDQGAGLVG